MIQNKENFFRILIIDDNPSIHADFKKILKMQTEDKELASIEEELFEEKKELSKDAENKKCNDNNPSLNLPFFEIDTATQGQEGVEKIRISLDEGRPFSLAFVDIRMPPGWDGIETIQHIWKIDKDIQIVICSAYSDYSWEETIHKLGMADNLLILKKPFDNVAVRQLAAALTKKWKMLQDKSKYTEFLEQEMEVRTNTLQESISQIRATLESSADGILVISKNGSITDYNTKFLKMWEIPEKIMESKNYKMVMYYMIKLLGEPNKLLSDIRNLENHPEQVRDSEISLTNGQVFEYYTQPHMLENKIIGRVWSFRDITERVYLQRKLEHQATHDTLTNLPNRMLLVDRIKHAMEYADKNNCSFAVIFIDLDNFKEINDTLSHDAGDMLLKEVTKRLLDKITEADTLARVGGDEFVMIIATLPKEARLAAIMNKFITEICQPFNILNNKVIVTASFGVSIYPKDGKTAHELLRNADLAMYLAKREGKNKFQIYSQELNEKTLYKFEKQIEIRHALANNEFFLYYQPQIDTQNGNKMVGVEALLRWNHPQLGIVFPTDFIDIAEESGLIIPIGEWILRTACKQNKAWQLAGLSKIRVAVNVTSLQIGESGFIEKLKNILNETKLEPQYLELGLTENIIMNNPKIDQILKHVRDLGVRVSFDDFGTGSSTLSYLRRIPIDQLKIDRSFVDSINKDNQSDEIIIKAIISMANALNLDVVAEGVENKEQLAFLNKNECHDIQGFLFSKALPPDEIALYLDKKHDN